MTSPFSITESPGIIRHLAAMLYDGLLLVALWFVATALLVAISNGHLTDPHRPLWLLYTLRVCLLVVTFMFYAWFWTHGGQTLGMRAWRLKLVSVDGGPVSWHQVVTRFAAAIPSVGILGAGVLWMLIDREHRTVHDHLSDTHLILLPKSA